MFAIAPPIEMARCGRLPRLGFLGVGSIGRRGAFHDFQAQRFRCSTTETLSSPPDIWGGRAAVAWACQLAVDRRFDAGAERFVEVASILDWVYGS
jgi:hypothetical protein